MGVGGRGGGGRGYGARGWQPAAGRPPAVPGRGVRHGGVRHRSTAGVAGGVGVGAGRHVCGRGTEGQKCGAGVKRWIVNWATMHHKERTTGIGSEV